jgi:hypothetical protein
MPPTSEHITAFLNRLSLFYIPGKESKYFCVLVQEHDPVFMSIGFNFIFRFFKQLIPKKAQQLNSKAVLCCGKGKMVSYTVCFLNVSQCLLKYSFR